MDDYMAACELSSCEVDGACCVINYCREFDTPGEKRVQADGCSAVWLDREGNLVPECPVMSTFGRWRAEHTCRLCWKNLYAVVFFRDR